MFYLGGKETVGFCLLIGEGWTLVMVSLVCKVLKTSFLS